jgi:hypothetical protein
MRRTVYRFYAELKDFLPTGERPRDATNREIVEEALGGSRGDREGRGVASGNPFTVRAPAFIVAGHFAHHMAILRERYL